MRHSELSSKVKQPATAEQAVSASFIQRSATQAAAIQPGSAGFYLQMQRTLGNRATQAYTRQMSRPMIQRTSPPPVQDEGSAFDDNVERASLVSETIGESFNGPADDLSDAYKDSKDAQVGKTAGGVGAVGSTADMAGGVLQIMSSIKAAIEISKNTETTQHNKNWNYAQQGANVVEGVGKTVNGATGLVDKSAKASGKLDGVGDSSIVSDYVGSVAESISAVKHTVATVKSIYDLYSKYHEQGGLSKADVARGMIETVGNALEAAQAGIKVAKTIMDIMEVGTSALTAVIPGVGIAISGVKIALKTVDVIQAGLHRRKMTLVKRDFKEKNSSAGYIKAKRWFGGNTGVDKDKLETHKQELLVKKSQGDTAAAEELKGIAEYELAKEMKYINVKRTDRASLQIGIELTKIAGDIATLTGVGAQVGTPLKIVATGVSFAMPVARGIKQMGRDRAAKAGAWGITKAIFNGDKSTDKKKEKRNKDADLIMDMFSSLPALDTANPSVVAQYKHVKSFVEATGMSMFYLEKFKTEPDKLKEKMIEAMIKRE
jgi:hypothetical protein